MDKKEFNDEKAKIKEAVLTVFNSPMTGPVIGAWGMQDSSKLNGLLKMLLGSLELIEYQEEEERE